MKEPTQEQRDRLEHHTAQLRGLAGRLRANTLYEPSELDVEAVEYAVKILERMMKRLFGERG